jgi:hypothetical protein
MTRLARRGGDFCPLSRPEFKFDLSTLATRLSDDRVAFLLASAA